MRFVFIAMLLFGDIVLADNKKDDRKAFEGTWTIVDRKRSDTKEPVTARTHGNFGADMDSRV